MARSKANAKARTNGQDGPGEGPVQSVQLEPLRVVRRELVSPNGKVVTVDVPVYPPFRLKNATRLKAG